MEKEYNQQWERLKEARAEMKEKAESLMLQETVFEKTKVKMREEAEQEKAKLLEDQDRMLGRSKAMLDRVQAMYQAQITIDEIEEIAAEKQIKRLQQDKHAMEEKMEMGIKRIRKNE